MRVEQHACSVCTVQGFARLDDGEGTGIGNIKREDLDLVLNLLEEKDLLARKSREHLCARLFSHARTRIRAPYRVQSASVTGVEY